MTDFQSNYIITNGLTVLSVTGAFILIEPIPDSDKYDSSIDLVIPDSYKSRMDQGIVKFVGPKCQYIEPGMWVTFPTLAGKNVFIESEHLMLIHEREIVAVFHGYDVPVPGLYHKDKSGNFFPATYEKSITLMKDAIRDETLVLGKSKMQYTGPKQPLELYEDEFSD